MNLIAVQMDDFDVILSIKFLVEKGAIPIPSMGSLPIMGKKPTMVSTKVKQSTELKLLSTLQFKKDVKQ